MQLNIEAFIKGTSQVILSPTKDCLTYLRIWEDKMHIFQWVTFLSNMFSITPLERDLFGKK